MEKRIVGKKMTLTQEEIIAVELGRISSVKGTDTYQRAKKYFEEKCKKLEENAIFKKAKIYPDEVENCIKMEFHFNVTKEEEETEAVIKEFEKAFKIFETIQ